jgi:short-subunit dehydrogenase
MDTPYGKVVMVTGASSGIGKAVAEYLAGNGFRVYGTSRSEKNAGVKIDNSNGFLEMISLDVCSEESAANAVKYVFEKEGSIDILINNAGFGIAGSVEDTSPEEAYSQFSTNFFGMLRMCRSVLPIMRKQHRGLIVNTSSVAGIISIPFQSMYSASKYAVEAMTEAMRMEVKPFGIRVSMVEPGDTKTGFTDKRVFTAGSMTNPAYHDAFTKSINAMAKSEQNGPNPTNVVKSVASIIRRKNPPIRVTAGISYKAIAFLKRIVPSRLVEFLVTKVY